MHLDNKKFSKYKIKSLCVDKRIFGFYLIFAKTGTCTTFATAKVATAQ